MPAPVTDAQRLHLFKTFEGLFPDEDVATMMAIVPTFDWNDVATKADLQLLAAELRAELKDDLLEQAGRFHEETNRLIGWMVGSIGLLTTVFSTVVLVAG